MFCLRRFAQSFGLCFRVLSCSIFLQVFIPIYRGFERRWEFSRYINLSCLKLWFFTLDLLPDLIVVLWRTNFKSIPLLKEQRLQQSYCYPCLVVETKIAEMVVAELVVVHIIHCPLSTLVKLLLTRYASDDHCFWWPCFWWRVLGALLQTRCFRRSTSDAFLQMHFFRGFKLQIKFLCSLTCSIRIFMNSTLIIILYTWTNV